jgi:putative YhdH/YhfP family quinone oxidoreductase
MMIPETFKALVVTETADKQYRRQVVEKRVTDLPAGDVLVRVRYSSINYKDVLSATGNKGVTRNYPHTPGIDAAGVVEQSRSAAFKPGDAVIVTSYDLGMNTDGGFGQFIRVPADWVVPLPAGLSLREAMIFGTAGFTAALSVWRLLELGLAPGQAEVLVSGATGGVGSLAVAILSRLGCTVAAVNGRTDQTDFLKKIGATVVISPEQAADASGRPLLKARWKAAVDTLGGAVLATTIKSMAPYGLVACCGNVASADLPLTVYPFILRGVTLIGIDSQNCPMALRRKVWDKLAADWKPVGLVELTTQIGLDELDRGIDIMMKGKRRGRIVLNL